MSPRPAPFAVVAASLFLAPFAPAAAQWDGPPALYQYQGCSTFGCHLLSIEIGRVADPFVLGTNTQDVWWGISWHASHSFIGPVGGWVAAPLHYAITGPAISSPDFDDDVWNAGACWLEIGQPHPGPWSCDDQPYGPLAPVAHVPAGLSAPDHASVTLELRRPFDGTDILSDSRTWQLNRVTPGIVTTPEPTSLALVGAGVVLAFIVRRRRA